MREGYIFYISFYEAIKELSENDRLVLYDAINEYSLLGNLPVLTGVPKAVFTLIKPQIDANQKKYDNGKKGGRPRRQTNQTDTESKPKENQDETEGEPTSMQYEASQEPTNNHSITEAEAKEKDKVNANKNDNVNEKGNVSLSARRGVPAAGGDTEKFRSAVLKIFFFKGFVSPMAEVDKFFAHYAKTGWMDGNGNRIRDIPAAAQCWEQKPPKNGKAYPLPTAFIQKWEQVYKAYEAIDPDRAPLLLEVFTIQPTNTTMNLGISERLHQAFPTLTDFFPIYNQFFNLELRIKVIK